MTQAKLQSSEYHAVPSITRYFNHVQFDQKVRTAADALSGEFALVELDVENAPIPERQVAAPKKKEKKEKADAPASSSATPAPAAEATAESATEPQQKKEKKEKKPKEAPADAGSSKKAAGGGGKGAKAPAADEGEPVPSMIDLRVGHIVDSMSLRSSYHAVVLNYCCSHEAS